MEFLHTLHRLWSTAEGRWSTIIPSLIGLGALVWFVLVYLRGRFRWLPAWAIARVTILDSIGRLEVIFLLIIGVLLVGVFGFNLFWPATRQLLMNSPVILNQINEITAGTSLVLTETEKLNLLCQLLGQAAMLMGEFFIAIIGFVLAMFLLPSEINRGVILSILPKPLTRGEYIFGKFLGTWIIVTACFLVLAVELLIVQVIFYSLHGHYPVNWHLVKAMCLFPFKYATLVLIIMGLTLRMPEAVAGILGLGVFVGGHFTEKIYDMSRDFFATGNVFFGWTFKGAYWILPHLTEAFSVNILNINTDTLTNWNAIWGWFWHISVYNCLLFWLLLWLFRRRSL